jgi:hypothetical protein
MMTKKSKFRTDNFHIGQDLFDMVAAVCERNECSRGQFYRRAIREQLKKLGATNADFVTMHSDRHFEKYELQ